MIGWEERSQWLRLTYRIARVASWDWVEWRWGGGKRGMMKRFLKEQNRVGRMESVVLVYLPYCWNRLLGLG